MNIIEKAYNRLRIYSGLFAEGVNLACRQCRFNASIKTKKDPVKFQSVILRLNHTLEKGMTLPSPRPGFGVEKAHKLISLLDEYERHYSDREFIRQQLQTLAGYIAFSGNSIDPEVEKRFRSLCKRVSIENPEHAGTETISREDIQAAAAGDFRSLLMSRHSVRDFQTAEVDARLLEEALALAARTPSACNRQAWRTHIYQGDDASDLLRWQGGCRGFEDSVRTAIIVTADNRAFLDYEVYQAYVDGGLYSMNLINALHFLGLGTIPLSLGFKSKKLKGLRSFGIQPSEAPVMIIGVGYLKESVKVASSLRRDIPFTNSYFKKQ